MVTFSAQANESPGSLNGHVIAMALSRGLLVMGGVWFASADVLN